MTRSSAVRRGITRTVGIVGLGAGVGCFVACGGGGSLMGGHGGGSSATGGAASGGNGGDVTGGRGGASTDGASGAGGNAGGSSTGTGGGPGGAGGAPAGHALAFKAGLNYFTDSARAVVVADMNGDGKPDLVVTHESIDVSILMNAGDGTFSAPTKIMAGLALRNSAVGDFNGDGKLDVAVAGLDRINLLVNSGDGKTFAAPVIMFSGITNCVVAADFNGDGKVDLALVGTSSVGVLLSNGNGTFAARVTYAIGGGALDAMQGSPPPAWLAAGDVNGDGWPDLVATSNANNTVSVLLNNAAGGFATPASYPVGNTPYGVAVGDLNGDGKADLAVSSAGPIGPGPTTGNVSVLLNVGGGAFAPSVAYAAGVNSYAVAIADLDGDGAPDLAFTNNTNDAVGVLRNQGAGTFAPLPASYGAGLRPFGLAAADLNGDGRADLAVANWGHMIGTPGGVTVLLNSRQGVVGAGNYTTGFASAGQSFWGLGMADLDADGRRDLVVTNTATPSLVLMMGGGAGVFTAATPIPTDGSPRGVKAIDLNGDGKADLAVANNGTDRVNVLLNSGPSSPVTTGRPSFAPKVDYSVGGAFGIDAGDLNGDDRPDLVVTTFTGVSVLVNAGDGTFAAPVSYPGPPNAFAIAMGDVNADGKLDVVVLGGQAAGVLLNTGAGTLSSSVSYPVGTDASSLALGDLNGDAKLDVAIGYFHTAAVGVLLNAGQGTFSATTSYPNGGNAHAVAIGDFDGDGRPDIACLLHELGTVAVLSNRGGGLFAAPLQFAAGTSPWAMALGDLNTDGSVDIVVANNLLYGSVTTLLNTSP